MAVPDGNFSFEIGTTITFKTSGGTVAFDPTSTADGRISADCDLQSAGDGIGAGLYGWKAKSSFTGAGLVIGEHVTVYLAFSDGIDNFNHALNSDIVSANSLKGLDSIGEINANSVIEADAFVAYGHVIIPTPHVQVVFWNGTTVNWLDTDNTNTFSLWPLLYKKF